MLGICSVKINKNRADFRRRDYFRSELTGTIVGSIFN